MKNSIFTFLFLSFSVFLFSQDNLCESGYMPFEEGLSFELTNFDKKNKVTSVSSQTVNSLENKSDGFKASVDFKVRNNKGDEMFEGGYGIECRGENIYMDMSNMFDPSAMAGMSNMEVEMNSDALEVPNNPRAGQELPEGTMTMNTKMNGMNLFSMNMRIYNRKIDGMEQVTTPAGTFDCVKITQETEMKMMVKKSFKSSSWYAKGIGMVKTENYDKKGRVESSTILTKIDR